MIEMSHTEDAKGDPFAGEEENQPTNDVSEKCHTALEILQNELINCERNISLEKSVLKQNEEKLECDAELKEISNEITAGYILNDNNKFVSPDENFASNTKDIFSNDQYCELIENIIRVGHHFNEIEEDDVQKMIFEYAEVNEIGHGFDKTSRKTGNEWYQQFIQLHPQLNSVIKKSSNHCVQLDETNTSYSSQIVDKFLSDYKNRRNDETKIDELQHKKLENENYMDVASDYEKKLEPALSLSCLKGEPSYLNNIEHSNSSSVVNDVETINRNESSYSFGKKSELTVEGVIETADIPDCVENCNNQAFSASSKNVCLVGEYPTKEDYSGNYENASNESNEKLNVTFENIAEMKGGDECDVVGVDFSNSITDVLPVTICDSSKNPNEDVIAKNVHLLVEKTNALTRENASCGETLDILSNEAVGTETRTNKDDNTTAVGCENDESYDIGNLSGGSVMLPENANCVSDSETSGFVGNTLTNLENAQIPSENSSFVDNVSNFRDQCNEDLPADPNSFFEKKSEDETTYLNTSLPSVWSPMKRKEGPFSIDAVNEGNEKKPKLSKKKRPSSLKKIKKSKYLYKLKSYSGSVLYFTSSTSVSFIKPIIKLNKLDESLYKNEDIIITSAPDDTAVLPEANRIDEVKTDSNTGNELEDRMETEQTSSDELLPEDHVGAELCSSPENNLVSAVESETKASPSNEIKDQIEAEINPALDNDSKEQVDAEINPALDNDSNEEVDAEINPTLGNDSKEQVDAEINPAHDNNSKKQVDAEINPAHDNNSKKQVDAEINPTLDNNSKEQVDAEINPALDIDSKEQVDAEMNPSDENDFKDVDKVESQSIAVDESKCEVVKETSSNADKDLEEKVVQPSEVVAEKKVNGPNNNYKSPATVLKVNSRSASITPTFSMQTRRKRLKFLPDGTLVTPNQRHQRFPNEFTSTPRSESKISKKRSLKTSSRDTCKLEKKMKTMSAPASVSNTPKQSSRSPTSTKKVSRNRPDRYIPKPNGQSKKPQKIFDYDSYYRENFRQTEVKLPPSCKKQMVALSKVTSISSGAQSGGPNVNPTQLLSCLLSMPITPDQIRTVRFKPRNKQLKPNKQVNITPSKLASNDGIKPITKRHLELLQKTPFNIVPKTEIGVAKSNANTKSQSST